MTLRPMMFSLAGVALLLACPVFSQQPADPAVDPLPPGALVRFGTTRPILRTSPGVGLIAPKFSNFLAPTTKGGIKRYDLGTGRPLEKNGIVGPGQVIVSADGRRAAVAWTGGVNVFEVVTGKQVGGLKPPNGVIIEGIPGVALSADGRVLAFAGKGRDNRGAVVVVDVDRNEVLAVCATNLAAPVYVALSRDGKTLVSYGPPAPVPSATPAPKAKVPVEKAPADPDALRTAQVWDVASGRELFKARVIGIGGNVVTAALSPDASLLAVAAGDGPIEIFDVKTGKRLRTLLGRKSQGVRIAFSPDGKTIASIGLDNRIQRWQTDGTRIDITEPPPGLRVAEITGLEFADNDRVIASMTANQFAYAWDAPTGKLLSPPMDHAAAIRSIAFPAGGQDLFTSGADSRAFRWNLATGALGEEIAFRPARIPGQPSIRPIVHLSSDGTRAVRHKAPIADVFDVLTGDNLYVIPPPSSPPATVTFAASPDGMRLACLSQPAAGKRTGRCVIWDLATKKKVAELETPSVAAGATPDAVFAPDGSRVVLIAFADSPRGASVLTLVGYDLKTGKKLSVVEDFKAVGKISFAAANDTTVIAAATTGRMWTIDYVNGRIGADFNDPISKVKTPLNSPIVVSPDGKCFAVGVAVELLTSYGVRIYDMASKKPLHTFVGHRGPVSAIHFSPDGNAVASGAQDTSVILWDLSKLPKDR